MERVELAVVGAGVMGLAAAKALAAGGREVVILERYRLGHDRGSSHGPTRIFRLNYEDPLYVDLGRRSLPLWRELEREAGRTLLDMCGMLDGGEPAVLSRIESAVVDSGLSCERVDRPSQRFPGVRLPGPALWSADAGVINAAGTVASLLRLAVAGGARLVEDAPVRIERADDEGVILALGSERLHATRCVLAAGAWTAAVLEPAGISLPLRPTLEQVCYLPQREDIPVVVSRGARMHYALPQRFGAPGAKVGEHAARRTVDPDAAMDPGVDRDAVEFAARALPALTPEPVAAETCLYTMTPDEDFVLDRAGPVVVVSPCSGHGFKFAPLIGDAAAALATGEEPPADLSRFAIARFK